MVRTEDHTLAIEAIALRKTGATWRAVIEALHSDRDTIVMAIARYEAARYDASHPIDRKDPLHYGILPAGS